MAAILYTMPSSPPGRAVLITAKALNIELEQKIVDLSKGEHLTPEYLQINPQHTVPVLVDGKTTLIDSHAIITYLVAKYGKNDELYPKDVVKRALVDQRLHFDSSTLFQKLRNIVRPLIYNGAKTIDQKLIDEANETYGMMEAFLDGQKWMAGNSVTLADISLLATTISLDSLVPINGKSYAKLAKWVANGNKLPYFRVNDAGQEDFANYMKPLLS